MRIEYKAEGGIYVGYEPVAIATTLKCFCPSEAPLLDGGLRHNHRRNLSRGRSCESSPPCQSEQNHYNGPLESHFVSSPGCTIPVLRSASDAAMVRFHGRNRAYSSRLRVT